jgi:parallel beta helix pectate lyase-like protein
MVLLVVLAGALTWATPTPAATGSFYVSTTGSNANPGTIGRPWRTLQKALNSLKPGQTAYVRGGTYPRWSNFERNGRADARVTIRNYPGEHPLITGRLRIRGSYLTVRGLHFRGQTASNPVDYLIYIYGGDHVYLKHNQLERGYKSAIYVGEPDDKARDLHVIGNYIHDNGKSPERLWRAHGLYCGHCRGGVIANNVFDHNLAWNLQIYPDARGLLITENTIVRAGASGIMIGGDSTLASSGITVANNILAFNKGWGLQMYDEGGPKPTSNLAKRNLFYRNGDGALRKAIGGLKVSYSLFGSPHFISASNYHLAAGSAAINRAMGPWVMPTDFDERRRPRGGGFDIGAYER